MINVCDAIMGTGKTQSAITWINEHNIDKFIYITPYLDEADRIRNGCPSLKFVEPSDKISKYNYKKTDHAAALIKKGSNITTTHQAFKWYTPEMLNDIKKYGYTLIIDEDVNVLEKFEYTDDDLRLAVDAGYINEDNGVYTVVDNTYKSGLLKDMFRLLKTRELVLTENKDDKDLSYWMLTKELITSFKNVFILTYLFEAQDLYRFMQVYNIDYKYIDIERTDDAANGFRFSEQQKYTPEYVTHLKEMIHIIDKEKLNDIGYDRNALSKHWLQTNSNGDTVQLRKNILNCFKNIWNDVPASKRMWATYKETKYLLIGKGYTNAFVPFNTKATNNYRNKTHLIYAINVYMNVSCKLFYRKMGAVVDEDMFALSIMVQWIWRSAIRDGKEIYLYIPSSRMRNILINWIESVSKGGNLVERKTL